MESFEDFWEGTTCISCTSCDQGCCQVKATNQMTYGCGVSIIMKSWLVQIEQNIGCLTEDSMQCLDLGSEGSHSSLLSAARSHLFKSNLLQQCQNLIFLDVWIIIFYHIYLPHFEKSEFF